MAKKAKTLREEDVMSPGPTHGDEIDDTPAGILSDDDPDDPDGDLQNEEDKNKPVEKTAIEKQLEALQAEINTLRAERREPKPAPVVKDEPEPDWEKLLFENPKEYQRLMRESISKEITGKLTKDYNEDQNKTKFWDAFYNDHKDLKDDDDIVRAILNANLGVLADMPVKQAGDKLAELTRERILKYTGGKPRTVEKKAVAEGANQPAPKPKPKSDDDSIVTLSDLIRARRLKRQAGPGKSTAA